MQYEALPSAINGLTLLILMLGAGACVAHRIYTTRRNRG